MIIYASANRDERFFANPARFDSRRDARPVRWGRLTSLNVFARVAECGG